MATNERLSKAAEKTDGADETQKMQPEKTATDERRSSAGGTDGSDQPATDKEAAEKRSVASGKSVAAEGSEQDKGQQKVDEKGSTVGGNDKAVESSELPDERADREVAGNRDRVIGEESRAAWKHDVELEITDLEKSTVGGLRIVKMTIKYDM